MPNTVFLCSSHGFWNRASCTSGNRWLLLAYVDMDFKFLILEVWDMWPSTPFALHQSSRNIFLWAFGPSVGVVVSTFSRCWFFLTPSSRLCCDVQTPAEKASFFLWPCESRQAHEQTRTHLPEESCGRSDIPLLSHWAHPSNYFYFFFFFSPLLSLFVWFDLGHWWQGCFSCQTNQ